MMNSNNYRYMCIVLLSGAICGCSTLGSLAESTNATSVIPGHRIPALETGAVPQGLSYWEDKNLLLISYYFTDGRASQIVSMDWKTGAVMQTTVLKELDGSDHCGHVGGIEISDSNLWIASDAYLYRYDLNDFIQNEQATALAKYKTEATEEVAFCTAYEGTIWAGEFSLGNKYPTHPNHHLTARDGTERGGWVIGQTPATGECKMILSIPDRAQDIQFRNEHIILSRSYGRRNSSSIEFYTNPLTEKPHRTVETSMGKEVPLWFLDASNLLHTITLPPMTENIEIIDEQLVVLFESGAKKYRRFGKQPTDHFLLINTDDILSP